jgi:hypothetical protein
MKTFNQFLDEGVLTSIGKKKPEKKAQKAMDAGAIAKRKLARRVHAKYVSGSEDLVPDDIREGMIDVIKKGAKRHSKAVEKKKIKNRKAVPYAALAAQHEPEGELVEGKKKGLDGKECWDGYKLAGTKKKGGKTVDNCVKEDELQEKDLSAAERRALPNKDFVFPGKGEGPEGKQRGAYPINDKKHARAALAMAAAHASPEKEAKVKAAVKKKYPEIEVSEGKAVGVVVKQLARIGAKKLKSKKVKKAIYKTAKKIGKAGVEGAVDAATDRAREVGSETVKNIGKKKEQVNEVAPAVAAGLKVGAKLAAQAAVAAAAEEGVKKVIKGKEKNKVEEGVLQMVKSIGRKKKPEKKAEKAQDAGARLRRKVERRVHAKYVSGSEDNVPDDIREEDKAFNYVVAKLKKQHGDGVLTKGDKMPELSAAQKKKNAEIRAKRAKEDHRDPTEKASDGRYSDRYSNRGSD